jgi:hypothetical protein
MNETIMVGLRYANGLMTFENGVTLEIDPLSVISQEVDPATGEVRVSVNYHGLAVRHQRMAIRDDEGRLRPGVVVDTSKLEVPRIGGRKASA